MDVYLKLSFSDVSYRTVTIYDWPPTRNSVPTAALPLAPLLRKQPVLSLEKRRDLTSMSEYMSPIDSQYYKHFLENDKVTDQSNTDDNQTTALPPTKRPKIL
ncbi:hypothetical protein DPMN_013959 [Dreissena polymorpha]|uniref:Uncharacterized protein n=1 Tax=Dreissena polymorpha TaxID=45954 RepID=A0A9D4S4S8_DREPO|nr:hypothetical protein DPMN_013959 [Dreissena polymorpha]